MSIGFPYHTSQSAGLTFSTSRPAHIVIDSPPSPALGSFRMKDTMLTVAASVASAVIVGALWWFVAGGRDRLDRWKVRRWLRANTRDEPRESHVTTEPLAKGTRLLEDRVRRACMSDRRVHRFPGPPEQWSI